MSIARKLWEQNVDLAQATLAHPFVQGLGAGTLPRSQFQQYIGQDAYFLDAFARAYALALARSPDREGLYDFFELLGGVLEELRLHAGYATRWGIELDVVTPEAATLAYTNFLLATASLRSVGEICAAMTPCMRLYAFLGQSLAANYPADNPYAEWIQTYASADFEVLAVCLETLLDRYATNDVASLQTIYRQAMLLEFAFFEAQLST